MTSENRPSTARRSNSEVSGEEPEHPFRKRDLWVIPVALVGLLTICLLGFSLAFLPAIAVMALELLTQNPFEYSTNASWFWRGLTLLCMTHALYGMYLISNWLERKVSAMFMPTILMLIATLACLAGGIMLQGHVLNLANAYTGKLQEIDAVIQRTEQYCTRYSQGVRFATRSEKVCRQRTYFKTEDGGSLVVRGSSHDPAILRLAPGTPVTLLACEGIFGIALVEVRRLAPERLRSQIIQSDRKRVLGESDRVVSCRGESSGNQPSMPSIMNALPVSSLFDWIFAAAPHAGSTHYA